MKRFALVLTVVAALAMFGTASANAADNYSGHGSTGHASYGQVYSSYGHSPQLGYVGHGYAAPAYGHGVVQQAYVGHGYAAPSYGGHGYAAPVYGAHGYNRSYGHGGGVRISTPQFGLRIGH